MPPRIAEAAMELAAVVQITVFELAPAVSPSQKASLNFFFTPFFTLGRRFQTVLDCGLFHAFDGDERREYVASLASVTEPDATVYVLCFSDEGPETGPHPVSKDDLKVAFSPGNGWNVITLEPDRIHTRFHGDRGAPAWFATIKRI